MHENISTLFCSVLLALLSASALAKSTPLKLDDFAYGTDVSSAETEFRRFTITPVIARDIRRRDLGDIRVFDEDNELMPMMIRKVDGGIKTRQQQLALYPYRVAGSIGGYVLDRTKDNKQWLKSLHLQWKKRATPKILSMRVEHSADKKTWKTLKKSEIVNNLKFNGIALNQNVIDIGSYTQRYIKLTFLNKKYSPTLASVTAHIASKKPSAPSWISAGTLQPLIDEPNSYRFSVSEGISPSLLKISFSKLNTVLSGALYAASTIDGKLKKKLAVDNFLAYKITLNNKVINSKPVDVGQWKSTEWFIAADDVSNLQEENSPDVMVAYPQYEVIFANDGDEPYTVVWSYAAAGKPVASDIVNRIKSSGITLKDIAVVTRSRILNNAELTELMESRQFPWLLLIGLFLLVAAAIAGKIGYQRFRSN